MDVELNGTLAAKSVVADKKRLSTPNEPPVLSRCEDPVLSDEQRPTETCSSPPSLSRETYVTRQRKSDLKLFPKIYRFNLQRNDRSERRNGATAGFGRVALRLLNKREKRKQRKHLHRKRKVRLAPLTATGVRTTRSRTAARVVSKQESSENFVASENVLGTAGTSRVLRPRKTESSAVSPVETVKNKPNTVHTCKEVPAKEKYVPEEVDFVDGIEILGFSSLDDLQKYTEVQEALKGPVHVSDEEVDVEYFSDLEDDPTSSMIASNTLNSFSASDSSRMSLFDSSDGEAGRSASRNDDEAWYMKDDPADEASCSSTKLTASDRHSKTLDKSEMPKVGQVIDLGLGRVLRPQTARNVHHLLDNAGTISRKMAEFSASVVTQRSKPIPKSRLVLPVMCPKLLKIMRYKWAVGEHGEQVTLSTAKTVRTVSKPATSVNNSENKPSQLLRTLLEPTTSQSADRRKRKSEVLRRPTKRVRRSKEVTVIGNKSDSENEIEEIKSEIKIVKVASLTTTEAAHSTMKDQRVPIKMEEPPKEVKEIVNEMLDFVALRNQETLIPFDPDQCAGQEDEEKSAPPVKAPTQRKRGAGLLHELRRLDVTVFDMDEKVEEDTPALESTSTEEDCKKDICRLGCVCESLAGRRAVMPTHCGRVDCMFECSCSSISYERRTEGRNLLDVSDATLAWMKDESERNLAKVEKQFKQTVVRAKDDLIVMGNKRSRREIKLPERYRENYLTTRDLLFEIPKTQKKSLPTSTPPLTPTNKSLSPSKLITPPKVEVSRPTPPLRPKFDETAQAPNPPSKLERPEIIDDREESSDDDDSVPTIKPCCVLLYRNGNEKPSPVHRNIALKSTSKIRHSHNILHSSARTSCNFSENHRLSKRNEDKLTSLWNHHSSDNEIFCHIVKEHSISTEEWERSGELAASDEPLSPLKKTPNSVQLIPWSFLRDKFLAGEYHIWYKCQAGSNKQKLYLTDGPTKPNKMCINLRELDESLFKGLPSMIAQLVVKNENPEDDDKDARCFVKSIGDYWMIAGYMQRTAAGTSSDINGLSATEPSVSKTSEDEVVEIDDPRSLLRQKPNAVQAQARWWLLHLTQTFEMLLFPELGVTVKYSQIKKTATLANTDKSGTFIRMCLKKNTKFGLYGVPGMTDCVLIGPYGLDQNPGFLAYFQTSSKRYVRVPVYCANKDSEYELESRKLATPEGLQQIPRRVIGTWLYDFKTLELPRTVPDKRQGKSSPVLPENEDVYFSPELRSRLEEKIKPELEPSRLAEALPAPAGRVKARTGQSLLKGSDEVKTINKNTLSVKIDGVATEAVVHVGEDIETNTQEKDGTLRGMLKIRKDLLKSSTPNVPKPRTTSSSLQKRLTDNVIHVNDDDNTDESGTGVTSLDDEPKRDFIVSNIKNLGYIPVTYVDESSVFIPHFGVPGQVRLFKTHDEVVKYVYQNVRQKIHFIGVRPETISWRQVDTLDEVMGERQFNPGILAGNHVITRSGVINMVKLKEEEIQSLNLLPREAEEISARLDHMNSLPSLRQLGRLLVGPKAGPLPQHAIVFMAVSEIQKLTAQSSVLKTKRKSLLKEQDKIKEKLRDLMKELPKEHQNKAKQEIEKVRGEKPGIILDEDSDSEEDEDSLLALTCTDTPATGPKAAASTAPASTVSASSAPTSTSPVVTVSTSPPSSKEFAVSEMVDLSSDEESEEEAVSKVPVTEQPSTTLTTVSKLPICSIVTPEAVPTPSTSITSTSTAEATNRKPQGLICKFPFSPLKRVNVTVKEDGIVASPSTNRMIQINQPIGTLTRSSDGSVIKAIKIVDPNSLKHIPTSQARIISTQPRVPVGASIMRPTISSTGAVPQKVQLVRTLPQATLGGPRAVVPGSSEARPRTVFMTRNGATVPMTVVRPKTGDPFVKLVTPNTEKVFIASPLPVVKATTDLRASGLKVLHPNIPAAQRLTSPRLTSPRLTSPPKPPIFRIIKPATSTSTSDNTVKVLLSPPKVGASSAPAASPTAGIAEIDTTELVID